MERQIGIIKGHFTKEFLERVLGEPDWEWTEDNEDNPPCGLSPGISQTAGWGCLAACGRIWIHKDGICFAPGLTVKGDIEYAESMYKKVKREIQEKESTLPTK